MKTRPAQHTQVPTTSCVIIHTGRRHKRAASRIATSGCSAQLVLTRCHLVRLKLHTKSHFTTVHTGRPSTPPRSTTEPAASMPGMTTMPSTPGNEACLTATVGTATLLYCQPGSGAAPTYHKHLPPPSSNHTIRPTSCNRYITTGKSSHLSPGASCRISCSSKTACQQKWLGHTSL